MKLFSICTPQAAALKNEWFLKTLQDDWELHIVDLDNVPQGNGDYLSREWYYCLKKKIDILIDAIKSNPDDIILFADMDIQFFRPCTGIIKECMQGHDIVFQMWRKSGTDVNPGFMSIRCNDKSRAFLEAVSAVPFDGRAFADQDVINDLLKKALRPFAGEFSRVTCTRSCWAWCLIQSHCTMPAPPLNPVSETDAPSRQWIIKSNSSRQFDNTWNPR
jgi:hypothetical protein